MNRIIPANSNELDTRRELQRLHAELAAMQRQNATILRLLTVVSERLSKLGNSENSIDNKISVISTELDELLAPHMAPENCPNCGAPLSHHPAPSGDLCICPACSWSQFIDQRGMGLNPPRGPAAPLTETSSPPSGWVGV